jgi:pimeloyl-ACP methyl ester carboxylesterase
VPSQEHIRPGYIDTPHGQLHYLESGMGRRAILLFHETPLSSKTFLPTIPHLATRVRVIAFDTPGYGGSAPPVERASIEGYGAALWSGIQQLGLDEIAVCGIHTGTAIAVELASRDRPGPKVVGAVLSGVTVFDAEARAVLATFADRENRPDEAAILQTWRDRAGRWVRAPAELLIQALADELEAFPRRRDGFKAVGDYDMQGAIARLKIPVLVLNGEKDSMAKIDAAAVTLFGDARLVLLPEWGGQLQWSAARIYADHLLDFLLPKFSPQAHP